MDVAAPLGASEAWEESVLVDGLEEVIPGGMQDIGRRGLKVQDRCSFGHIRLNVPGWRQPRADRLL